MEKMKKNEYDENLLSAENFYAIPYNTPTSVIRLYPYGFDPTLENTHTLVEIEDPTEKRQLSRVMRDPINSLASEN